MEMEREKINMNGIVIIPVYHSEPINKRWNFYCHERI